MVQILINPVAGPGLKDHRVETITAYFQEKNVPHQVFISSSPGDITRYIEASVQENETLVIAGGDGTLQEAFLGLYQSNKKNPIVILPVGTGNDLVRSLDHSLDLQEALAHFEHPSPKEMFTGLCNDHLFINVVSTGLDAAIVKTRESIKKWFKGPSSYLISTIITLLFYRPRVYEITTEQTTFSGAFYLVAVGNGQYYGGGMKITPKASVYKNQLDVCIIEKKNRFRMLMLLPTIYSGRHVTYDFVKHFQCERLSIKMKETCLVNYDGELIKESSLDICKNKTFKPNIM